MPTTETHELGAFVRRRLAVRLLLPALVAVLLAGAGTYLVLRLVFAEDAPFAPWDGGGFVSVGGPADPDEPVSITVLSLRNRSKRTATLERVELVDATPGMRLVGSCASGLGPAVGLDYGFPPRAETVARSPVAGYRVGPGQEVVIVIGVTVDHRGRFVSNGVRLLYHARRHHRGDWPSRVVLCAPKAVYRRISCALPED